MHKFHSMLCLLAIMITGVAAANKQYYSQLFLHPKFNGKPLSYCLLGDSKCGDVVAQKYCHLMGYKRSDKYTKAYNVGLANYIDASWQCKGWRCNSFGLIRCISELSHPPAEPYHYRYKRFAYPRYKTYRLAWCKKSHKGCGYGAAYAFCRYLGYMNVKHYEKESTVAATKAIGDNSICFGNNCNGFKAIHCKR